MNLKIFTRKKYIIILILLMLLILTSCGSKDKQEKDTDKTTNTAESNNTKSYRQISQEEAKAMMEADDGHIIVDVRTQDEFDEGHIPGAICIPNESIGDKQPSELPDLDQIILVYCRSGRRSKEASQKLADIGYTRVYEFGGIIDWTGEVVKGDDK
jgi:rhodanese-related sulfurtransferase